MRVTVSGLWPLDCVTAWFAWRSLMFSTEDKLRLRPAMANRGLQEVRFRFDFEGTKVRLQ
jgi:hypothetical protein